MTWLSSLLLSFETDGTSQRPVSIIQMRREQRPDQLASYPPDHRSRPQWIGARHGSIGAELIAEPIRQPMDLALTA
jgi:hypothetical protein